MIARGEIPGMTLDDVPFALGRSMSYDSLMEQARSYQARLRTRAAALLRPAKLAAYDQQVAERMVIVSAILQSTVPGQAKAAH